MTPKQIAINAIHELPEDATWEDIQERINFVTAVALGISEADAGKLVSHDKVKNELAS